MKYSLVGVKGTYASQSETVIPIPRLGYPHLHRPCRQFAEKQTGPRNPEMGIQSSGVGQADYPTDNRARQDRMHLHRNRRGQNSDGEAAAKSLQQHRPGNIGMLAGDRHQYVNHTKTTP